MTIRGSRSARPEAPEPARPLRGVACLQRCRPHSAARYATNVPRPETVQTPVPGAPAVAVSEASSEPACSLSARESNHEAGGSTLPSPSLWRCFLVVEMRARVDVILGTLAAGLVVTASSRVAQGGGAMVDADGMYSALLRKLAQLTSASGASGAASTSEAEASADRAAMQRTLSAMAEAHLQLAARQRASDERLAQAEALLAEMQASTKGARTRG